MQSFELLNENELENIDGGDNWKTISSVGPGLYQRNTDTGEYRWIQTKDNFSYTLEVVTNGWASSLAGGYFVQK